MGLIEQTNASTKPRSISHYRPGGYHGYSSSLSGEDAVVAGIIGGVVGGVLLVGLIVFLVVYYCYFQKKARHGGPVQVVRPPEAGVNGMNNNNNNNNISDGAAGVPPSTQHQAIQPLGVPNANPFAPGYYGNNNNNMGRNDYAPTVGVPMQAQTNGYGNGVYYVRNENCDEVRAFSRVGSTLSQKSASSAGSNDYDYGSNYRR